MSLSPDFTRDLLFHYTTAEVAASHILKSMELRFSPVSGVNDPHEANPWNISVVLDREGDDAADFFDLQREMDAALRGRCSILSFAVDAPSHESTEAVLEPGLGLGGISHDRMWAQYSDNHRGVCLLVDRQRFSAACQASADAAGDTFLEGPVAYEPSRSYRARDGFSIDEIRNLGVETLADRHVQSYWKEIYFSKPVDWISESEYRMIRLSRSQASFTCVPIEASLVGVCFGCACSEENRTEMRARVKDGDVQWLQISPSGASIVLPAP